MRFLTVFNCVKHEKAASVLSELKKIYELNGYITYADVIKFFIFEQCKNTLPELYYKVGWTNIMEVEIKENLLMMPPIKNIENKINYVKENKNERTDTKNS